MNSRLTYIKNIIIPGILFSAVTGILTGAMIFLFKLASGVVIQKSSELYEHARQNPKYIWILVLAVLFIGIVAGTLLKFAPHCRGGGIPTAVSILRGLIRFNWIKSAFLVFFSSLLTYAGGVPLGNEGPSVQIGTALGKGTVRLLAPKQKAWDRYVMTGGACAGFAVATGAPVSGIFFALEEAHRRFSPMIITVAISSVLSGVMTSDLLCALTGADISAFSVSVDTVIAMRYIWTAIPVGLMCGLTAALIAKAFRVLHELAKVTLQKLSPIVKIATVFLCVAIVGILSPDFIGDGHSLLHSILHNSTVWYMLIVFLLIRVFFVIVANNAGVTGGLFIPTLVFGAVVGSLCAKALISLGLIPPDCYSLIVVVGMASMLGSSVRTPITAIIFAIEAFSGLPNIAFIALGVAVAYIVVEMLGVESMNDIVIGYKLSEENKGKKSCVVDTYVTVRNGSFAVGKETRDIFWPPSCVVLSVKKSNDPTSRRESGGIQAGDILHVHYLTTDPQGAADALCAIVGKQDFCAQSSDAEGLHPPAHME